MTTATIKFNGRTIKLVALNSAGMGFIANLICSGWYPKEEEQYELALQHQDMVEVIEL